MVAWGAVWRDEARGTPGAQPGPVCVLGEDGAAPGGAGSLTPLRHPLRQELRPAAVTVTPCPPPGLQSSGDPPCQVALSLEKATAARAAVGLVWS